jgi:hypothetical protein
VLDVGIVGTWDDIQVNFGSVIFDGTIYYCWYSGRLRSETVEGGIGYATSTDGLTWTKHPNPVLTKGMAGSFDGGNVQSCCVIKDGDYFKMWYQGWAGGYLDCCIGYATSNDGIHWAKYTGNPVLDGGESGSWNSFGVFMPSVVFDGVTYHMWYSGIGSRGQPWRIGYATSSNGIAWTEHPDNPVFRAGDSGSWEEGVLGSSVLFHGTTFHMWYSGRGADDKFRIGYAKSPDGIDWTKADDVNPVLDLVTEPWEQDGISPGAVLFDQTESIYKMWYSGLQDGIWRIGYATSTITSISVKENVIESKPPIEFRLEQNYPNPFNPETIIRYQLALSGRVSLKVFNMLGKEIRTLVDEIKPAGSFEVLWDSKDDLGQRVASGVYLYRLESRDFVQSRKMILLQ